MGELFKNQMNDLLKYLIIVTLAYYLVKGLLYLMLWQMTYKVQEKSLAEKKKQKERRKVEKEIWQNKHEDS
jgi:fucose permease